MRKREYADLGVTARWLDAIKARHAFDHALRYSAETRYGLNEEKVTHIEKLHMTSIPVSVAWVRERMPDTGTVQIVYGRSEVCIVDSKDFLIHWINLFSPCRDDVIVLHNLSNKVLFYCHEDEIEVGCRSDGKGCI